MNWEVSLMSYVVDNAVIMAAGLSSRFVPISFERPKALINVKGEVLIERQIRQLQEAGIRDIFVVVGYKKEMFNYLIEKTGVHILENTEYAKRNNHSSLYAARKYLKNTYICSADNYFSVNPFEAEVEESYYAALYSAGPTEEWCLKCDGNDWITEVTVGGRDSWYMMGHVFFSEKFSERFVRILCEEYNQEETKNKLWEAIYKEHIKELPLKVRRYKRNDICEFDSLDELREFDKRYQEDSGSAIMQKIALKLGCVENEIVHLKPLKNGLERTVGMKFALRGFNYQYLYETGKIISV